MEILLIAKERLEGFTPNETELVFDLVDGIFALPVYEKTLHQWSRASTKYSINTAKKRIFNRWKSIAKKVDLGTKLKNVKKIYIVTEDGKSTKYSDYLKKFIIWESARYVVY